MLYKLVALLLPPPLSPSERNRACLLLGMILDEATSALANLTEKAMMEAVHNVGHEITISLIACRLSTVKA